MSTFGNRPEPIPKAEMTHTVFCHVCPHPQDRVPRNRARMIGSAKYGGLWHCEKHQHEQCGCPHGDWTEPADWWREAKPV